jgi:hypothetical protein
MFLQGNGALTPDRNLERFNNRVSEIETAIIAESARWGDARTGSSYNRDDNWTPEINKVRSDFFPVRTNMVINQLKQQGLYTLLNAPQILISGNPVYEKNYNIYTNTHLSIENPNSTGTLYYTLNGSDPRLVGGEISASAIDGGSSEDMLLNSSTVIMARVYYNGNWSAIRYINLFSNVDDYSGLKVTELNYHPLDKIIGSDTISGKSYEFIEFKNTGETALNLSGFVLDSAVYFEFPQNTILAPQNFYVVASKPSWFYNRYGKIASGNYSGNLANSGEEILLNDSEGNEIIHFVYDDHSPWPEEPDGDGFTLVSIEENPTGDPASPYYWRASYRIHGSPFGNDRFNTSIETPESDNNIASKILVYPNPTQGELNIKRNASASGEVMVIKIYSISGILLFETKSGSDLHINLHGLNMESGIYIVQVKLQDRIETRKIIYR